MTEEKKLEPVMLSEPIMQRLLMACAEVQKAKGADYAKESDRLANFRQASEQLGLPMRQVWAVYFWKHVCAVLNHARRGKVESEPIEGRLQDLINYACLYAMIVAEEAPHG
jgi:hypothetical protein